jgi:hypothetical protein
MRSGGIGPLPRGKHGLPREEVVRSQRERLLTATGRETFYQLFEDRRTCVLEAHQVLLDDLIRQVRVAYAGPGEWVERCRATIAALLDWFAADPLAGRFLLVELPAVGPEFHERFEEGFDRFVAVIDSGLDPDLPEPEPLPATSLAVGAAISRIYSEVAAGRTDELPTLVPALTYEVLVPFLGEDAAHEAAFAEVPQAG